MAKSYNVNFQDTHYGRIQLDDKGIRVAEATKEEYRPYMEGLIEELRREGQTDAELWKELPERLSGRLFVS